MTKYILLFIALTTCFDMIHAQNNMFGIRRVNTKAGTVVNAPRSDSKKYNIKIPKMQQDLDVTFVFQEYADGKPIKSDLPHIIRTKIHRDHDFNLVFVPEIQKNGTFQLFIFRPGVIDCNYMFPMDNKSLKFVLYPSAKTILNKPLNTILVYEDNENDSMEKLVNKYVKDGYLEINSNLDKKLRSKLKRYSVFYYIINSVKNEK